MIAKKTSALAMWMLAGVPLAQASYTTPGTFDVLPSGAATYTVPVQLPPGVRGVEPKLALSYNSGRGNGLLGVGWGLSGWSAITRCPRTKAQDDVRGSVRYDTNDRYCLDGQRLIAISGADGGNNTEYRTELESFAKITSHGGVAGNPTHFIVRTRSGMVIEFGNTADSRIEAVRATGVTVSWPAGTIVAWAQNRIRDSRGNYVDWEYTEDSTHGQWYPREVRYTGNLAGLQPQSRVVFSYEDRGDAVPKYHEGAYSKLTKRMNKLQTFNGSALVKEYRLAYGVGTATQRSRLASLQECDASSACLVPIIFESTNPVPSLESATGGLLGSYAVGPYAAYQKRIGDLNGDGRIDLVWMHSSDNGLHAYTALGKGDGTFHPAQSNVVSTLGFGTWDAYDESTADLNADGLADLVWMYSGDAGLYAYTALGKGDGTFHPAQRGSLSSLGFGSYDAYAKHVGDVNGDGRSDLIWMYSGGAGLHAYTALGKGDGTFLPAQGSGLSSENYGAYADYVKHVADINGDGLADLVWTYTGSLGIAVRSAISRGDGTFFPATGGGFPADMVADPNYKAHVVDVNADGLGDVVWMRAIDTGLYAYVSLSKGNGYFSLPTGGRISAAGRHFDSPSSLTQAIGTFDGDGLADLVWMWSNDEGLWAYTARGIGDGTFVPSTERWVSNLGFGTFDAYARLVADADGDGLSDPIWMYSGDSGLAAQVARTGMATHPDMLARIDTAPGADVSISMSALPKNGIYAKGAITSYPVLTWTPPMQVVATLQAGNGAGGIVTTSYRYGGLRAELGTGRGLLGFAWLEATNAETGIITRSEYLQDFPYIGAVSRVTRGKTGVGHGGLLSERLNTYACHNPAEVNSNCIPAVGKRYLPVVVQSAQHSWQLDGFAMHRLSTNTRYDCSYVPAGSPPLTGACYGNVTQVVTSTTDGHTSTTENSYSNDTANWILGKLIRSTVTSNAPDKSGLGVMPP